MRWTRAIAAAMAAACALLPAGAGDPAGSGSSLAFVKPLHRGRVVGEVEIELRVVPAPGLAARRIDLTVDGKPLATLTSPPWKTVWDAGEARSAHEIAAVLLLSDGSTVRSSVRTSPFRVDFVENVDLVNLYAVVRGTSGDYVTGLGRDDFRLFENGRPQEIDRFGTDWKALRVAIVLDTSLTMKGEKLEAARDAALGFLDLLVEGDEGLVVTFSDSAVVAQDLTRDPEALRAAIENVRAEGGTALYDAIYRASNLLGQFEGRRVMVLLSDGRDEAANGLEPGSLHTLEESLDRALRNEVMIFAIGFGRRLEHTPDFYGRESLASILTKLGEATGGRVLFSVRPGQLRKAFEDVAQDLRHQYSLAYVSDDRRRDGTWREIRLSATRPGLKVTTRRGYFAPGGEASAPPSKRRPAPGESR